MTDADGDWVDELMWVRRRAGTHLSGSTQSDGRSPLLRDDETGELAGHATLHPAEDRHVGGNVSEPEPTSSVLAELLAAALVIGALKGAETLAPHARRLWDQRALPAISGRWTRLARFRGAAQGQAPDELITVAESAAMGTALELAAGDSARGERMTSDEARKRWAAALLARAFSDEQFRRLRKARIEDPEGVAQGELDAATSSAEQVEAVVNPVPESDPSLLEDLLGWPWQVAQEPERPEGEPLAEG